MPRPLPASQHASCSHEASQGDDTSLPNHEILGLLRLTVPKKIQAIRRDVESSQSRGGEVNLDMLGALNIDDHRARKY